MDFTLPIAAWGEDKQSVIIELTNELNNPGSGLFKVSSYSLLSHPDPNLSGIDGFRMLNQWVVFSVTRTQSVFTLILKCNRDRTSPLLLHWKGYSATTRTFRDLESQPSGLWF